MGLALFHHFALPGPPSPVLLYPSIPFAAGFRRSVPCWRPEKRTQDCTTQVQQKPEARWDSPEERKQGMLPG
jgi:hypothetical protein